jgi:cytochrome P450
MPKSWMNDPKALVNLEPHITKLQETGPLVQMRVPLIGKVWATTTDAGARTLLKDDNRFVRNPRNAGGKDVTRLYWWMPRFMHPLMKNILLSDGADHTRLRSAVDAAFKRNSIEALRHEISSQARALLHSIDPNRPVDIIPTYARALPLQAICALLGIRPEVRQQLTRAIEPIAGPTGLVTMLRAFPGLHKALRLLRAEIAHHRAAPGPGLISALVHPNPGTDELTDDELLSMFFTLFVAGHETTVHLIGDTLLSMTEDETLMQLFAGADDKAQALAVEEAMRFHAPVMMTKPLYVRADTTFEGQLLKQGEQVIALLAAANRDPARAACPHDFQLDRRPNAHLGFGFGPHVCLGMQLARIEAQIALHELASAYPNMKRADLSPPQFSRRFGMRGLKSLKLQLAP